MFDPPLAAAWQRFFRLCATCNQGLFQPFSFANGCPNSPISVMTRCMIPLPPQTLFSEPIVFQAIHLRSLIMKLRQDRPKLASRRLEKRPASDGNPNWSIKNLAAANDPNQRCKEPITLASWICSMTGAEVTLPIPKFANASAADLRRPTLPVKPRLLSEPCP